MTSKGSSISNLGGGVTRARRNHPEVWATAVPHLLHAQPPADSFLCASWHGVLLRSMVAVVLRPCETKPPPLVREAEPGFLLVRGRG